MPWLYEVTTVAADLPNGTITIGYDYWHSSQPAQKVSASFSTDVQPSTSAADLFTNAKTAIERTVRRTARTRELGVLATAEIGIDRTVSGES